MKTTAKIVTVLLVAVLLFTAVIGFMEMPIPDENGELTKAQEIIVLLKTHLDKILSACGVSVSAVVLWLVSTIDKSTKLAFNSSSESNAHLTEMEEKFKEMESKIDTTASQKVDVVMEALMSIFLASEIPASVREKLLSIKDKYDDIGTPVLNKSNELIEIISNIANTATTIGAKPVQEEEPKEETVVSRF